MRKSQETILNRFNNKSERASSFYLLAHQRPHKPCFFSEAGNDRKAALNVALQALRVLFNAELLFMCRNDIMPNQVVFQILIMPLEVHYL